MGSDAVLAIHCKDIKRLPRKMLEELAKVRIRITDENPLPRPEVKLYLVSSSSLLPKGWVRVADYLFWLEHADDLCEDTDVAEEGIIWIERDYGWETRPNDVYPWDISITVRKDGQIGIGEYGNDYWVLSPRQVRNIIKYLEAALKKAKELGDGKTQ